MKLNIEQPALQSLISRVVGVVEKRNTIPILSNILLSAAGNELSVRATDLDIDVITSSECRVESAGSCTVRADLISAIISKLNKGKEISLILKDGNLSITSGKSSFNLATLPADEYPVISSQSYDADFTIPGDEFSRLIGLSAFAMSQEETRYYLNGVYLHPVDGVVCAVATDGHRLALISSEVAAQFPGVIIPRKTVAEVKKLTGTDEINISVSAHKIRIDFGDTQLTSKTIDGTFPDYTRVIPTGNNKTATFEANTVKDASARVSLVATERTKSVKIDLTRDLVTLTVDGTDGDKGVEDIDAEYDGEDMRIGVNSKYLAEVLSVCTGDTVKMKLSYTMSPILIKPSGDDMATFVVMPFRV